jgi:ABC-type sugar transport system ATPase subunit
LLVDEPTRGVDVGAKLELFKVLDVVFLTPEATAIRSSQAFQEKC